MAAHGLGSSGLVAAYPMVAQSLKNRHGNGALTGLSEQAAGEVAAWGERISGCTVLESGVVGIASGGELQQGKVNIGFQLMMI